MSPTPANEGLTDNSPSDPPRSPPMYVARSLSSCQG